MQQNAQSAVYGRLFDVLHGRRRPLVVGVSGAYTSGKTMFAMGLGRYLREKGVKVQVIHYDDFHRPFSTIAWTDGGEIDAFYNHAFDPQKLVAQILAPLRSQGGINRDIACVNLGTGQFTNTLHFDIDAATVVLLEGVLLFRPPLLEYLDYTVYLDISPDEMLRRGRQRDVPQFGEGILEKYVTRYIPVQRQYMAEWAPQAASDMVIDNSDWRAPRIILDRAQP